jgi:leader peptidase (prepilin peptidase)/N-methyltransferase
MNVFALNIIVILFGLCVGSFLNVCIYRIPLSKSIAFPGSSCTNCSSSIRFYDNIPVLSFIWLKGKCRKCGYLISLRYPMVEITTSLIFLSLFLNFGFSFELIIYFIFFSFLIIIIFIDIDHQIIPNIITLPGIIFFLCTSFFTSSITFIQSLSGIIAGGGILYIVALTYYLFTKKEGMGGGDIKLLAMIGAFVGWKGVVFTIFIASFSGTIAGILIILIKGQSFKDKIPFGPFLSIGAMTYIFLGTELISLYLKLMG